MAHEIGIQLAKRLWGERFQVIVATHLDKENHLHNHFVVNTVSFADGLRYHRTEKDYYDMQKASDELCREYGLSVIENPKRGKSKQYGEWRAEREGKPTWRSLIKADVDKAIAESMTDRQFFYHLRSQGYEIKMGKDISVKPPGQGTLFPACPQLWRGLHPGRDMQTNSCPLPPKAAAAGAGKADYDRHSAWQSENR